MIKISHKSTDIQPKSLEAGLVTREYSNMGLTFENLINDKILNW